MAQTRQRKILTVDEIHARWVRAETGLSTGEYRVDVESKTNWWVIRRVGKRDVCKRLVVVDLKRRRGRCFCEDAENRGGPCKHVIMVAITIRRADEFWRKEAEAA